MRKQRSAPRSSAEDRAPNSQHPPAARHSAADIAAGTDKFERVRPDLTRLLAAEVPGQRAGGALHRVGVGVRVIVGATIDESMLGILVADEFERTPYGRRREPSRDAEI